MADREIVRVRKLARVLDTYFVDPIVGFLLPGAGDVASSVIGLYIVGIALKRRFSPVIIARMLLNLAADAALGVVPLVGDLGDVVMRANTRNLALLESRAERGGRATPRDWAMASGAVSMVALAFLLFVAAIVGSVFLVAKLIDAIAHGL
jgi:hypothetical protein